MNIEWQLPYGSDNVNEFPTDAWHRFLKYSYCWRMESLKTLCHYWCRSRRRNLGHFRTRKHHWKLSDGWRMEWTAKTNSRWTHEISWENRVIVDTWNHWWKPRHYWPEIISENRVTVDLEIIGENLVIVEREIIIENWVTHDAWNRQRKLIHGGHMKSVEKIELSLTHGIAGENRVTADQKSSAKTEWL
jgi:hypothetical protein